MNQNDSNYPIDSNTEINPESGGSQWFDIILYLFFGFMSQGAFIYLISSFLALNFDGPLGLNEISVAISIPFISFVGTFFFLGILGGKVSINQIGLLWNRWDWKNGIYAIGLIIVFMPIRIGAAFGVEYLLNGNFDFSSLESRNEFFNTFPSIPFGFPIMLIGVGILAPLAEELFFRGLIYNWFRDRFSVGFSVFVSSLMFGIAHYDSPGVMASALVMGIVLGYSYERTESLWLPFLIHAFTNAGSVIVLYSVVMLEKLQLLPTL